MLLTLLTTALLMGASKTEIQVNVCESEAALSQRLELPTWKKKTAEQSRFIETPNLHLFHQGWVFRARQTMQGGPVEIMLKKNSPLRRIDEEAGESCEYDLHGNLKKLACKMTGVVTAAEFAQLVASRNFRGLLSNQQLDWLRENRTELPENLQITSGFTDQDFSAIVAGRKYELGITKNAKGTEFTEISIRADESSELREQASLLECLKSRSIKLCDNQGAVNTRNKLKSFFEPDPPLDK